MIGATGTCAAFSRPSRIYRLGRLCSLLLAAKLLCGCAKVHLQWMEEIQLQQGTQLTVERTAAGRKRAELGGPKGWEQTEMSIAFGQAPAGAVRPPTWRAAYVPILIDYDPATRTWSLVTAFYRCETWYALGRPMPPYVQYQSTDGQPWRKTPLDERFIGRPANLLTGPRSDGEPELVTIGDKTRRNRSAAPLFKQVLRRWGSEEENFCEPL